MTHPRINISHAMKTSKLRLSLCSFLAHWIVSKFNILVFEGTGQFFCAISRLTYRTGSTNYSGANFLGARAREREKRRARKARKTLPRAFSSSHARAPLIRFTTPALASACYPGYSTEWSWIIIFTDKYIFFYICYHGSVSKLRLSIDCQVFSRRFSTSHMLQYR